MILVCEATGVEDVRDPWTLRKKLCGASLVHKPPDPVELRVTPERQEPTLGTRSTGSLI
ncbi:hypothetical protein KBZ18_14575 [Synechococcus sp. Cruz-9H2]|uniref:hypothetical protein n=1 Tax=unclassified Synechococcus TaxID=2626047 RepID=UPI0020CE7826|nr:MULTISPECIES: hypothetical protein [unclassified Synechococcus]MCP9820707.1 hypothetical protein [Synechococcus sp. Cruz-9H2]MCP9844907.1 hypothetical protein [Synechococcus sp. Edmonson 11F2]MCP9857028.1 hypothetical protein [Synechococcus sp. Cruz-9C9]MCP9871617.1 hypothetical protein [Synechococcus sp. Cruz-7B9]